MLFRNVIPDITVFGHSYVFWVSLVVFKFLPASLPNISSLWQLVHLYWLPAGYFIHCYLPTLMSWIIALVYAKPMNSQWQNNWILSGQNSAGRWLLTLKWIFTDLVYVYIQTLCWGNNGPCQSEREIQNNQKLSHHILFTPASHCMCDEQWCWVSEAQYYCTVYYKHAAGEMKYNVITDG